MDQNCADKLGSNSDVGKSLRIVQENESIKYSNTMQCVREDADRHLGIDDVHTHGPETMQAWTQATKHTSKNCIDTPVMQPYIAASIIRLNMWKACSSSSRRQ